MRRRFQNRTSSYASAARAGALTTASATVPGVLRPSEVRTLKDKPERHQTPCTHSDVEHETRTSKRRLEEGSEETESRCGPHKKASEAKSPHAEENDVESSTDGEFDNIIRP